MFESIREVTSQATLEEKKKLRKEFRLFDMVFYSLTAIIGIDTLGAVASKGGSTFSWLLISAVTFVLPYGLLTAELGSTFTQEGGMYEWCKLAGGRYFAAIASMLYWISNPLWVGGTLAIAAIAAIKTFWFGNTSILFGGTTLIDSIVEMLIALVFIWGTTWCAITSLRFGKWLSILGSYIKFALIVLFLLLVIGFVVGGHSTGAHLQFTDLNPFGDWGAIFSAILPLLIFNWVGFEVQNGAAEEMINPQRDVPRSIIRVGLIAVVAYSIPIAAMLFALPKDQLTNVGGFVTSFQVVSHILPGYISSPLGWIVAVGIVVALASSGGTWIIGADRTYAMAALDRNAPAFLGRFSGKYGTPIVVNAFSGIVATLAMGAAIMINAFGGNNIQSLFVLVIGFTISTTTLSYLFIFPAFLILRYKYPNVPRVYKVPGGMVGAWIVTLLPLAYAAIASYFILVPTDATVASTPGITRTTYELTQFIPLILIFLVATIFYIWGQREKRNQDVVIELRLGEDTTNLPDRGDIAPSTGD